MQTVLCVHFATYNQVDVSELYSIPALIGGRSGIIFLAVRRAAFVAFPSLLLYLRSPRQLT